MFELDKNQRPVWITRMKSKPNPKSRSGVRMEMVAKSQITNSVVLNGKVHEDDVSRSIRDAEKAGVVFLYDQLQHRDFLADLDAILEAKYRAMFLFDVRTKRQQFQAICMPYAHFRTTSSEDGELRVAFLFSSKVPTTNMTHVAMSRLAGNMILENFDVQTRDLNEKRVYFSL